MADKTAKTDPKKDEERKLLEAGKKRLARMKRAGVKSYSELRSHDKRPDLEYREVVRWPPGVTFHSNADPIKDSAIQPPTFTANTDPLGERLDRIEASIRRLENVEARVGHLEGVLDVVLKNLSV